MIQIVDDEEAIRDALSFLFNSRGLATQSWASGEDFLAALPDLDCSCIILDVRMAGMSGLETFDGLRAQGCTASVIFLTGHADVPIAVQALKAGAFDFLEKPFNDNQIVDLALKAVSSHRSISDQANAQQDLANRRASLSPREEEVLALVLSGAMNKQIADRLNIAVRTVEVHRGRVLSKMGVRNAIELAALMASAQSPGLTPR